MGLKTLLPSLVHLNQPYTNKTFRLFKCNETSFNHKQVWITLLVIMISVALALAFTSCIYNKYIEKKTDNVSLEIHMIENILLTISNITNRSKFY